MPDQIAVLPLAKALSDLETPDAVHRLAMSYLPDLRGASRSIRADLGVLYRLALPTEYGGQKGSLVIRFRADLDLPGELAVSPRWFVGRRGGRSFTLRDLTGTVSSISETGASAYHQGIGRGKAYGYGMPLVL